MRQNCIADVLYTGVYNQKINGGQAKKEVASAAA